jgi:uncharacterized membrane protein
VNEAKETGRIEAFSDGVFSVGITLLVLDIKVPTIPLSNPHASLSHELAAQWPTYAAFVTSFLTILVMWINHHRVFGLIRRSDDRILILNGLLLLAVTIVPFSTSLVAAYIRHPSARIAVLVYAGTIEFLALCYKGVWHYAATDGRLLAQDHDAVVAQGITKSYRHAPLLYAIAMALTYVSPMAGIGLCMALAVFFIIPPAKHVTRHRQRTT